MREERSGWRDAALSLRHREWGIHCPMVDIDFIGVEYDDGDPRAIIEYTHHEGLPKRLKHPSYKALRKLANRAHLPLLSARYNPEQWWFIARGLNPLGEKLIGMPSPETREFSERQWVRFLWEEVRGRTLWEGIATKLNDRTP